MKWTSNVTLTLFHFSFFLMQTFYFHSSKCICVISRKFAFSHLLIQMSLVTAYTTQILVANEITIYKTIVAVKKYTNRCRCKLKRYIKNSKSYFFINLCFHLAPRNIVLYFLWLVRIIRCSNGVDVICYFRFILTGWQALIMRVFYASNRRFMSSEYPQDPLTGDTGNYLSCMRRFLYTVSRKSSENL